MRIFLWHVHGSWTTALVQGDHEYLVPVLPDRGPDGRGRARTWDWPASVVEVTPEEAAAADVDVVVLQRPAELHDLAQAWLGRRPGRDVPAVRWRPWRVAHVLLGDQDIACAGCRARVCPVPGHPCVGTVAVSDVVAAVDSLAPQRGPERPDRAGATVVGARP